MSRWWRGVGIALGIYLVLTLILWYSAVYIFGRTYDGEVKNKVNAEKHAATVIGTKASLFTMSNSTTAIVEWQEAL
jgi:hypothetical protein